MQSKLIVWLAVLMPILGYAILCIDLPEPNNRFDSNHWFHSMFNHCISEFHHFALQCQKPICEKLDLFD